MNVDFDQVQQARYLLQLREGVPPRMAARAIGFEPKTVATYRKETPLFEEEVQEALQEADEAVLVQLRKAALRGDAFALRAYSTRWGWTEKKDDKKQQINVFNGVQLEGNPMERLLKMQKAALERPESEIPPLIVDVT